MNGENDSMKYVPLSQFHVADNEVYLPPSCNVLMRPYQQMDNFFLNFSINWFKQDRHRHATSKGMDSYQMTIGHMEVRPDR